VFTTIIVSFNNENDDCTYSDLERYCLDQNNNLLMETKIGADGGRSYYFINARTWRHFDVHVGEE